MEALTSYFTSTHEWVYIMRIIIAAICGGCIGLEREHRLKNAGIRTHILVAMAASLMVIVSKYGFFDVVIYNSIQLDASRIASSVVQAIGFIGAGVIFVRKDNVIGVTTAAGLWGTVGIGIAIGAGLYITGITVSFLMIFIQFMMHYKKISFSHAITGYVTLIPNDSTIPISDMGSVFKDHKLTVKTMRAEKTEDGLIISANLIFDRTLPIETQVEKLEEIGKVLNIDISIYG
ncbi:MAG: MgtC/SapB family protein [Sphaerochaetaceae bacterium]|nr:MgtC/SapB family protein [Sphaerochaetaceae bacterium]